MTTTQENIADTNLDESGTKGHVEEDISKDLNASSMSLEINTSDDKAASTAPVPLLSPSPQTLAALEDRKQFSIEDSEHGLVRRPFPYQYCFAQTEFVAPLQEVDVDMSKGSDESPSGALSSPVSLLQAIYLVV